MNHANLVLHILMRDDLDSMNAGKAMAQASHAYGALQSMRIRSEVWHQMILAWMEQTSQNFGTTLVLAGNEDRIDCAIQDAIRLHGETTVAGWVFDPTYPLRDGLVTHLIPLRTCGFILGDRQEVRGYLTYGMELHP